MNISVSRNGEYFQTAEQLSTDKERPCAMEFFGQ
jgi:hypothetical protein